VCILLLAVHCLSGSSRWYWMFGFKVHRSKYLFGRVNLEATYFATAHLFTINIDFLFEENIRWIDGNTFFSCLELSFCIAISSVATSKRWVYQSIILACTSYSLQAYLRGVRSPQTKTFCLRSIFLRHRCSSKQIFGCARIFSLLLPNLPKKFLCDFAYKFSPTKIMNTIFGMISKTALHVFFCKHWAAFFEMKQRWAPFLPGFSGILPRFSTNQTFGSVLAPPAPPAPPPPTPLFWDSVC